LAAKKGKKLTTNKGTNVGRAHRSYGTLVIEEFIGKDPLPVMFKEEL
jgi:hypothetical protein